MESTMEQVTEAQREEYCRRYNSLYSLVLQAYADMYMLEAITELRPDSNSLDPDAFYTLRHICELIKSDFALTIWKVLIDENDGEANTLRTLCTYLGQKFEKRIKNKFSQLTLQIAKDIQAIRKKHLAHNDKEKSGVKIKVEDMRLVIEEVREKLNALCCPQISEEVSPIDDKTLRVLKDRRKQGIGRLIVSAEAIRCDDNILI